MALLLALPLGVIGRLASVILALPGHLLYYFTLTYITITFTYTKSSVNL